MPMKIATWNVNSLRVRLPHVLDWLEANKPDVLALQELKLPEEDYPFEALAAAGYQSIVNGQRTYNGVAILTREHATKDIIKDIPDLEDPQRRVIAATIQDYRVINLYVPNGESITSDKYQYKLAWLAKLKPWLQQELKQHAKLIVLGDFNIAPEAQDVYAPEEWSGQVLFSEPEHQALQGMLGLGLQDCFRLFDQPEKSYSWWDYRMNSFKRKRGLRIDLILASAAAQCSACHIDATPRAAERPSDHAPVVATFN